MQHVSRRKIQGARSKLATLYLASRCKDARSNVAHQTRCKTQDSHKAQKYEAALIVKPESVLLCFADYVAENTLISLLLLLRLLEIFKI